MKGESKVGISYLRGFVGKAIPKRVEYSAEERKKLRRSLGAEGEVQGGGKRGCG